MRGWTALIVLLAFMLTACSGVTRVHNPAADQVWPPQDALIPYDQGTKTTAAKNLAVFFDGTGNDFNTTSNVGRLYQLTINQDRTDIAAFYTSGVGADRTSVLGLATGLGFREDVQNAYRFLAENYAGPRDKIHLYGYSRGAFSARALAGFVHTVGLVDLENLSPQERDALIHKLFTAYKFARNRPPLPGCRIRWNASQQSIDERRCATKRVLQGEGIAVRFSHDAVRFAMVGLWDTVETLGLPNGTDAQDQTNWRYSDQICNMDRVAHAVSLHDNRAGPYTPVLMTRLRLVADCETPGTDHFKRINEVWFAGDHGQIGGTEALGYISGLSLNWMLDQASDAGVKAPIFPATAAVYAPARDFVKDAEGQSLLFRTLFARQLRNIRCYGQLGSPGQWRTGSAVEGIKIHPSVAERLDGNPVRTSRRSPYDRKPVANLPGPEQVRQVTRIDDATAKDEACADIPVRFTEG